MKPELHIFGITIPTFGLMVSIGVLCFALIILTLFRKNHISENKIDKLIIVCGLAGAIFALSAVFFDALWHNISTYKETGSFNWEWWGITFSGGLFGGILSYFIIYYFIMKYDRSKMFFFLDIIVVGLCVAHGFGRIGCFFGGCCYGKTVEPHTFLSIYYPINEAGTTYAWILPTQLYEAVFLFIFAAILFFFIKKNRCGWYFIGYNVFRFLLEYLRGDDRGSSPFGFLSPSQFMSIIMFLWGIVLLIWRNPLENWLQKKNVLEPTAETNNHHNLEQINEEKTKDPNINE